MNESKERKSHECIDVTKENFLEESKHFLDQLPKAVFVAIDEEMTGISVPAPDGGRVFMPKDDTPEKRFLRIKEAAERYSIIQFGITLFFEKKSVPADSNDDVNDQNKTEKNSMLSSEFEVKMYNFHLFSSKREVVINPSTAGFLANHGMDFNLWMKKGISYVHGKDAKKLWARFEKRHSASSSSAKNINQFHFKEFTKPEDITFIARTMAKLREWLDKAGSQSLALDPCNSFLRLALYNTIGSEYPALVLEKGNQANIIVYRLSPEEKKNRDLRKKIKDKEHVERDQVGFYRIIEALSRVNQGLPLSTESADFVNADTENFSKSKKIPIIIHNGLMDLLFILTHFHQSSLPEKWSETKRLISSYFPLLYDTKYMVSECPCGDFEHTDLSRLYSKCYEMQTDKIIENAHNAAFDSFMTGAVFHRLCMNIIHPDEQSFFEMLEKDNKTESSIFGRNKLNLMLTMFNIDLEDTTDPICKTINPKYTYRITNIESSLRTSDILSRIPDNNRYKITWIDDTTFLVSQTQVPLHDCNMGEEMVAAFPTYDVESLSDYIQKSSQINDHQSHSKQIGTFSNLLYGVFSYFGSQRGVKRRRVED